MPDRYQIKSFLQDTPAVSELRDRLSDFDTRAIITEDEHAPLILEALGALVPEKVIREKTRPALIVKNDSFEEPELEIWKTRLADARSFVERAIKAVGRVEFRDHPTYDWNGTAWMISESVMVTNRHVALLFAERRDTTFVFRRNARLKEIKAMIDLKEEHGSPEERELVVNEVLYIEDDRSDRPDVAFLRVSGNGPLPDSLPLSTSPLQSQDLVATIGYPSFDPDELPSVAREIFNGIYSVKRVSPGWIINAQESDHFSFSHDCTTMGGNSGSAVVSLLTGEAVGLHYAGVSRAANYAVDATTLKTLYDHYVK